MLPSPQATLNALAQRARLAYVSKTPGRTQHINLFRLTSGALLADLRRRGKPMSIKDSLIAAVGLAHNLAVVTLNQRDFEPAQVQLVDPSADAETRAKRDSRCTPAVMVSGRSSQPSRLAIDAAASPAG